MPTRVHRSGDFIRLVLPTASVVLIGIADFSFSINKTTGQVNLIDNLTPITYKEKGINLQDKSGLDIGSLGQIEFYLNLITGVGASGGASFASQAETDDGTIANKAVSPLTNKNFKGEIGVFLNPRGAFAGTAGWADVGFSGEIPVLLFARNTTEKAVYMFYISERFVLTDFNPVFSFVVYSQNAPVLTTGDKVRWQVEARYYETGESTTKPADETLLATQTLTELSADVDEGIFQVTLDRAKIAIGDRVMFTLSRIGGDPLDNYNDDIAIGQSGLIIESKTTNP